METLLKIVIIAPPLLVAVMLHEIAHGLAAERLGDDTARRLGRITLNPLKHIDFKMTILLPTLLIMAGSPIVFGGAKPVPVDIRRLRNPLKGMGIVAIAGPIMNFLLAGISYLLFVGTRAGAAAVFSEQFKIDSNEILLLSVFYVVIQIFAYSVVINLVLGVFNLLPVPPLDGGRIAVALLPRSLAIRWARLEPFGILIVIALLYFGVIDQVLGPILDFALQKLR